MHKRSKIIKRPAAGYMLVLGATMLITVIGYAAIVTARINTRIVTGTNDWARAGELAIATAELAPLILAESPDWRTDLTSGEPVSFKLDGYEVNLVFIDEDDDDFSTGLYDPIRAYGIAMVGDAVRVRSVLLTPNSTVPMSCLELAAYSVDGLVGLTATLSTNQMIGTAAGMTGLLLTINGDVEYATTFLGVILNGTQNKAAEKRTMPDSSSVFDYYVNNGTAIPLDSLSSFDGRPSISDAVLTPTSNPYTGELNSEGIYVIDCDGGAINIVNSRIDGTLVLLNAADSLLSAHSAVVGQVTWKPAVPNYPALMVQGQIDLDFEGGVAMKETTLGVNLNPIGSPYNGDEDASLDDEYRSGIQGIVYASDGTALIGNSPYISGALLSDAEMNLSGGTKATVNYSNRYYLDPPPGFGAGPYQPVVGTWRWDEAPCALNFTPCSTDADCCSGTCNNGTGKCRPSAVVEIDVSLTK
ncbi:MAG TPA: hypothetical protein PKN33_09020 [Phycisphaerae bacterium]|nr:hypothetical protein [Phycisphaerae bacterium]